MPELPGPTWRRLKSCLEYKFRDIDVPATNHEDRLKQLGLLVGLTSGRDTVLYDEALQLEMGQKEGTGRSATDLVDQVHALAKQAPLEQYLR